MKREIPVLNPLVGYARWASTYSTESNPIKDSSNGLVLKFLPDLHGKSVLDVGCGTGHFCSIAQKLGAAKIVGVDFSENMLAEARVNCPGAEFIHTDASNLPFEPDSFDIVICALVLGHIKNINPVLSKLSQLIRKDGYFIITDFHPKQTEMNSKRTFQDLSTGEIFEIEHYLHPLDHTIAELKSNGLSIKLFDEPEWKDVPVIYALQALKE